MVCKPVLVVAAARFYECWFQCWNHQHHVRLLQHCVSRVKTKSMTSQLKMIFFPLLSGSSFFCIAHLILWSLSRSSYGAFCLFLFLGEGYIGIFQLCSSAVQIWTLKTSIFLKGESLASLQRAAGNDGWGLEACYERGWFCNLIYLFCT